MASVEELRNLFELGHIKLTDTLDELPNIGEHIFGNLQRAGMVTLMDLIRASANKSKAELYDLLSQSSANARGNTCVRNSGRDLVSSQYHIRAVNYRAYTTLRNALEAARHVWALAARRVSASSIPDAYAERDAAAAVCSCVRSENECRNLERRRYCAWSDGACRPRNLSVPVAFRGVGQEAGQFERQGRPPPGSRWNRQWRVPDNR